MNIGRKIYYGKTNGIVIIDIGEKTGNVAETTFEEDCITYPMLALIDRDKLGVKKLQYGELSEQFKNCNGYKVNPDNGEIIFETNLKPRVSDIEQLKQDNLIIMDALATIFETVLGG